MLAVVGCGVVLADAGSGPWYANGTFWSIVGVVIAAGGILVAIRAAPGPPQLYYAVVWSRKLDWLSPNMRKTAVKPYPGIRKLRDPLVVLVQVISRGRSDIRPEAFNGPIELRLSTPILAVVDRISVAEHVGPPPDSVDGATLKIGPALLSRRHIVKYILVVEGHPARPPTLSLHHRPANVDVRNRVRTNLPWRWLATGLAIGVLVWNAVVPGQPVPALIDVLYWVFISICVVVLLVIVWRRP